MKSTLFARFFLMALLAAGCPGLAQDASPGPAGAPFELADGDRVVFVGNALFENDQDFGYLELALTTRWPGRNLTFRNIGWSGDNVFGEARSYITNPPTAYDLLIEQITGANPTVIFMAYGAIESQEGEAGLPRFNDGYQQLLDRVSGLNARLVLLSPTPVFSAGGVDVSSPDNLALQLYGTAISRIAAARNARFVDVFKPLSAAARSATLSDNGIHLNESGYYCLALALERGLGLPERRESAEITVSGKGGYTSSSPSLRLLPDSDPKSGFRFTWDEPLLPLPVPSALSEVATQVRHLRVTGLKKGFYTLYADGVQLLTASAGLWEQGMVIGQGVAHERAERLRGLIVKKNGLYFHQYRPPNRTYILGFRSYEQGRHKQGLEDLNILITWLEAQIAAQRAPRQQVYQFIPTK